MTVVVAAILGVVVRVGCKAGLLNVGECRFALRVLVRRMVEEGVACVERGEVVKVAVEFLCWE